MASAKVNGFSDVEAGAEPGLNVSISQAVQRRNAQETQAGSCKGGVGDLVIKVFTVFLIIITFPISLWFCVRLVQEYERAIIFRLGRLVDGKPKGPGIFYVNCFIDSIVVTDLRTVMFDVEPQEVLTSDSVTTRVNGVVYYRVFDPVQSVLNVDGVHDATRSLAQTMLRNVLATRSLREILVEREEVSSTLQRLLDEATDQWGVKVERVEIKDITLPENLQRSMAAEAEASREARAKAIAAEGELNASHALRQASDVMAQGQGAMQLRMLHTLREISQEKNSTIVLPFPVEMLKLAGVDQQPALKRE